MKRAISITLVVAMLVMLMSGTTFAAEPHAMVASADPGTLVITAENVTGEPGQWVSIILRVDQNPGFSALQFYPYFAVESWTWKANNKNTELLNEFDESFFDLSSGKQIILDTQESDDCYGTGVLMEVRVQIPEGTAAGAYTVEFKLTQCLNAVYQNVSVKLPTVTITVEGGECAHAHTTAMDAVAPTCKIGRAHV